MLCRLAALFAQMGHLSCKIINEAEGLPHSTLYRTRFGTITAAYEQIGYQQKSSIEYRTIKRALAERFAEVAAGVMAEIENAGLDPICEQPSGRFRIGSMVFSLFIVRYAHTATRGRAWVIRRRHGFASDQIVAVRMERTNWYPLDYLLLPAARMHPHRINLATRDSSMIDAYRFQSLDALVTAVQRLLSSADHLDPSQKG
jgi:hypothetical protein